MKRLLKKGLYFNGGALLIALLYAALFTLSERWELGLFDCFWKKIFGVSCPGCGGSRAVLSLLRLDFLSALYFSPGVVFGVFLLLWYDILLLLSLWRRDASLEKKFPLWSLCLLPAVFLLTFFVRLYLTLGLGIPPI